MGKKPSGRLRFFKPAAKPVQPARSPAELDITVERQSAEGRGIGFFEGRPVFVAGVLPGERARVRVYTDKREFIEAQLLELFDAAPERQTPPCELFGRCGGCQLQMLPYGPQVEHKQNVLKRLLAGFDTLRWSEPLLAEPWHYRHRARLSVTHDAAGAPQVGFKSAHSHAVVPVPACPVLDERLQPLLRALPQWLARLPHWQRVREIIIAVDAGGRIAVSLETQPALARADRDLLEVLAAEAHIVFGEATESLRYAIPSQGIDFQFGPRDFTQVNPGINDQLVARCLDWLEPGGDDHIADFFCGLGNFSLALAQRAGCVVGVESVAAMVARAGGNAARLGLSNVRFVQADLFAEALVLPAGINKAVLDPPRAGAKELCRHLAKTRIERLVYVSCNPQTLARDLGILVEGGLKVSRASLVDMFPQTGHSEVVVLLER